MTINHTPKTPATLRNKVGDFLRPYPLVHRFALFLERIPKILYGFARLIIVVTHQSFGGKSKYLVKQNTTYLADGFATTHFVAFLNDKKFLSAYEKSMGFTDPQLIAKFATTDIRWRAHIATWAAQRALRLEGDFIECGVWYGLLSKTICEYLNFDSQTTKTFYLVDTWGDPCEKSLNHPGFPDDVFDVVKKRFEPYKNVKLVRGHVPNILDSIPVKKISYLSIDMNGDFAERRTLEKYYELLVPGAIIYFDDYGWNYPKLRETVDDFFKDKPEFLLHFPSGNSIVVKL